MDDNQSFKDVNDLIQQFNKSLNLSFPLLEKEIDKIIAAKSSDIDNLEDKLNTLLTLAKLGIAERLFIKLLEYYKTVDAEKAMKYWSDFDNF